MHNIPSIDMRLISGTDSLENIREDWQTVLDEMENPPLMASPDWLFRWWKYYGDNRQLRVGQFFDGDTCIGIAPLCLRTHHYRGGLSFERLEFMGAEGQDEDDIGSDYLNLIALPGREAEVANNFVDHLTKGDFGDWHECMLNAIDGSDPMTSFLASALDNKKVTSRLMQVTEAPYLQLEPDWDSHLQKLSKKRRYRFRKSFRDFEDYTADDGYQIHTANDAQSLAKGMKILKELHTERWITTGEQGVFSSQRWQDFHKEFSSLMLKKEQLLLTWLTIGDKPVAALYHFMCGQKIYYYQGGRSMDVPSHIQLGVSMLVLNITKTMEMGFKEYDFLAGTDSYKYNFTKKVRPIMELRISRPSSRETLRKALVAGRDLSEQIKGKVAALQKTNGGTTKTDRIG